MSYPLRRAALAVLALIALAVAGCGGTSGNPSAAASSTAITGPSTTCSYVPDGSPPAKPVDPPPAQEATTGAVSVDLALPGGTVTVALDRTATPCTVGNFVHLSQAKYYDGTPCHRLTVADGFGVLQCGDPTGTGGGGPGYTFADETTPDMTYPAGTIAMANGGADTNGSQFFLVYADTQLAANYTVFGKVTAGMDVLTAIAAKGTADGSQDGAPAEKVTIASATVTGAVTG